MTFSDVPNQSLVARLPAKQRTPTLQDPKPDVILQDYNQKPIPVGTKVDLMFLFGDKSVTAPAYVQAMGSSQSETCLLGTNVLFALGLMQAAEGVHRRTGDGTQMRLVCLVRSERIPGHMGAYLEVRVD